MGIKARMIATPMIPAHRISFHKMMEAAIVVIGENHNGCQVDKLAKRCTSFDSKFTNFPGDVSLIAICDSRSA